MVVTEARELASIYREVVSYPAPTEACVIVNGTVATVTSRWSQRDLERMEKSTFERCHSLDLASGKVLVQTGPTEVKNVLWNTPSPSGKLRAVVRTGKDKKNEDKHFIEIFDATRKLKTIDVLALEKHGKIIENDGQFGSFEWSSSEGHLLYMAEKKKAKTGSFFDPKAFKDQSVGDDDDQPVTPDDVQRGDEYEFRESWGEQLVERYQPMVCILDIEANTVSVLENLPEDVSPGQAMWCPDDAGVVVCGWFNTPFKLGLKFCCQRKSFLYHIDIKTGAAVPLSEEGRAVRFPRFSPDLRSLIYLDVPVGGPHNQCARLVKIDWATKTRTVVVKEVANATDGEFPGIFTYSMSRDVWFGDSVHLALTTNWRSALAVIIVNTETGAVTRVKKDTEPGSMSVLCVCNNVMVLACSSPDLTFHLLVGHLPHPSPPTSTPHWVYPDGPPVPLSWLSWSVLQHTPSPDRVHPKYKSLDYESILCLPKQTDSKELPPLIVFSHGGPNTAFDTSFIVMTSFFCRCGFAVLMTNYRGSLGFGQDSLLSLMGQIGTQDVRDVESSMVEVVSQGKVDGNRLFACGGSHGGFLTTHLIGQYPDTFKAAASRNPVINLASMFSTTDIRDWTFAQSGLVFDHKLLCDDKHLAKLWKASPLSHVDKVKTPIMLMIGLSDRRVPPSQGMEYYRALRARGVPIRYLTYPDNNHSLTDVDVEADCMTNMVLWFNRHMAH